MDSALGKIIKSNSHIDYVCQIYGPGEHAAPPAPAAYAFGTFVAIERGDGSVPAGEDGTRIIGVIYNTLLMNPDYGNLGPRLSSRAELEVFSPDYLSETATLVGILAVGWIDEEGRAQQGVPAPSAAINGPVRRLKPAEVCDFHRGNSGKLALHYAPLLMRQSDPLIAPLLLEILEHLSELFPDERARLNVMRSSVAWRSIVQPAG